MTSIVSNSVLSSTIYPPPPPPPIPLPVIPSYPDEILQSATDHEDPAAEPPNPDAPRALKTTLGDRKNWQTPARSQPHPWGNLGGGLSWPLPLSTSQQNALLAAAIEHADNAPGSAQVSRQGGLLEFLNSNLPLPNDASIDPVKSLEALIGSHRGQALGEALQIKLEGISTDSSVSDYVLAAINLDLDQESTAQPHRNQVAGFDLTQKQHWGKPVSSIVAGLRQHLSDTGKASSPYATLGAHLLLMRTAPQFLIKDIPDSVVYGSQAWANLCIAAAAIEAESPGRVANMSFAEVMITADASRAAPESAKTAALLDWAIVNGVLEAKDDALHEKADIDTAMDAFNHQLEKLKHASSLLGAPVPTRQQLALDLLKEKFGKGVPFEEKVLLKPNKTANKMIPTRGPYSMLDLTMQGEKINASEWALKPGSQGVDLDAFAAFTQGPHFKVPDTFDNAISQTISDYKTVKKYSTLNALANLPPDDKNNLRLGKLNFYKEKSYRVSWVPLAGETLFHTSKKILVTTKNQENLSTYEFDTEKGTIRKVGNSIITRGDQKIADEVTRIEEFSTFGSKRDYIKQENPLEGFNPNLFKNLRAEYLADSIVEGLDLDAIRQQAAGSTPDEHREAVAGTIGNFFLDLIPLRSAIVNLSNGHYKDGFSDLAFDALGLLTAGVGAVAKAGKTLGTAGGAVSKALKVSKIFGAAALSELNPLSGLGDLAIGAGKLSLQGANAASQSMRTLKGTTNNTALIAPGDRFEAAATGTFKVGTQTVEGSAVQVNGKWYALNAQKQQPYGSPLQPFESSDTLMPPSPNPYAPLSRGAHRFNPINVIIPPRKVRKPLPEGTYAEAMKGKLEADHFKTDTRQATMDKFQQEMKDYYKAIDIDGIPPRPVIPEVPIPLAVGDLIKEALKTSSGLVLGESHKQMASFKVLFDNVSTLKDQGVKKVYLEGYIDMLHGPIDDGIGMLGSSGTRRTHPSLEQLKNKLEANGIELLPLDHYYLTRHKYDKSRDRTQTGINSEKRLKEFNYYAAETIQANSGTEKWVALVGHAHMNTSEGVPGLAELTESIGIGVFDNKNMPYHSIGLKAHTHVPDPNKPLQPGDLPGDLHIYVKP
ncbi:membrane-targeted effector domain-containing toxin [Pseudomonas sp. ATCC PTA-122608]|uniref:membrane-targeted effector domain-containing toxin n=1 Tax=Pseudomonas sp. ATCC PTA-122608 TaxID=1771311 RepID=UPI002114E35A|nr:membrane-targeted effector domain-containing toxin [Pseudomonas sp. ATCC PTA-122608]